MGFQDRAEAGRLLAGALEELRGLDVVVLGLPRGGVPVAFEVARALHAPLDVIVVRKVGVPWQPELAMGAVGEGGVDVVDTAVVRGEGVRPEVLAAAQAQAAAEVKHRVEALRGGRGRVPLAGRTAIVVDDGVATGSTARAACQVARAQGAARVVLAVPVAQPDAAADLAKVADQVVCLQRPSWFVAVGEFYDDFTPTVEDEVQALLSRADEIVIDLGAVRLDGRLSVPPDARGVVVFAHGSGSSRHSPRNRYVAGVLHGSGLATLVFDLLTAGEEADRTNVFDIGLLAARLGDVVSWVRRRPGVAELPVELFGASTGAAAALCAAADPAAKIASVVSRGGRPDLAGDCLGAVRAPTLLIVGARDQAVLELNRRAQARLRCLNRLEVVPGATHLFEEPGTLQTAAALAARWFATHLGPAVPAR